mmetsp:Transcript_75324/g.176835  ORF Transcript_75324/g.176835 Transcript_75324/m.176835 type:complete len:206 (+) Transcript_75324:139-756(+)
MSRRRLPIEAMHPILLKINHQLRGKLGRKLEEVLRHNHRIGSNLNLLLWQVATDVLGKVVAGAHERASGVSDCTESRLEAVVERVTEPIPLGERTVSLQLSLHIVYVHRPANTLVESLEDLNSVVTGTRRELNLGSEPVEAKLGEGVLLLADEGGVGRVEQRAEVGVGDNSTELGHDWLKELTVVIAEGGVILDDDVAVETGEAG